MFRPLPDLQDVNFRVPVWSEVRLYTPSFFLDNGASDPTRCVTWRFMSRACRELIDTIAREHDAGYSIFMLRGAPNGYEYVTRHGWDLMLAYAIRDAGYPIAARHIYTGLRLFGESRVSLGRKAWDKNKAEMHATYLDYEDMRQYRTLARDIVAINKHCPFTGRRIYLG